MKINIDSKLVQSFFIAIILSLGTLALIYLLFPLFGALAIALFSIYFLSPLVKIIKKRIKIHWLSVIIAFIIFLVPSLFFIFLVFAKISFEILKLLQNPMIKQYIGNYTYPYLEDFSRISIKNLSYLLSYKEWLAKSFVIMHKFTLSLMNWTVQFFIGMFSAFYVMIRLENINKIISSIKNDKLLEFLKFVDRGLKQVFYSIFITALITGLISAPIYWYFSLPYFATLSALTGILTLIPVVGAWLVYLPLTGYIALQQGLMKGILFLTICAIFISVLPDIAVRPLIAGYSREVDILALLFGFVCGIIAFGPVGIIIGPLIVIVAIGFIKVFLLG